MIDINNFSSFRTNLTYIKNIHILNIFYWKESTIYGQNNFYRRYDDSIISD